LYEQYERLAGAAHMMTDVLLFQQFYDHRKFVRSWERDGVPCLLL